MNIDYRARGLSEAASAAISAAQEIDLLAYIPNTEWAAIAARTSTFDCTPALRNAIAAVTESVDSQTKGGPRIVLPYGVVNLNSTIELKRTVTIEGTSGSGQEGAQGTTLQFPANTCGFIVERFNTTGTGIESPTTQGGDSTVFRNLRILGGGGTDTTAHGIFLRSRASLENVRIDNFAGDGIHIFATGGGGGSLEGNANNFEISGSCRVTNCENGLFIDGADVNAGYAIGLDCSNNRAWGVYDSSFLGNTYVGLHCATNGTPTSSATPWKRGTAYTLNTLRCPTNFNGFIYKVTTAGTSDAATEPTWPTTIGLTVTDGTVVWTCNAVVKGGSYRTDNVNARSVFSGCYVESGQLAPAIIAPSAVIGGVLGSATFGPEVVVQGDGTGATAAVHVSGAGAVDGARFLTPGTGYTWMTLTVRSSIPVTHAALTAVLSGGAGASITISAGGSGYQQNSGFRLSPAGQTNVGPMQWDTPPQGGRATSMLTVPTFDEALRLTAQGDATNGLSPFTWDDTNKFWCVRHNRQAGRTPLNFTTDLSTFTGGRASALTGGSMVLSQGGFWFGNSLANSRNITTGTAIPSTGEAAQGDIIFNISAAAGGKAGWVCTTGGVNGSTSVWKAFGAIDP